MIARRRIIAALAGFSAAPTLALAQSAARVYRLGWLASSAPRSESYWRLFEQRLRENGFVEGRNLVIEYRNAEGNLDRLPALADELSRLSCDAYFSVGVEASLKALVQGTRATPIVVAAIDYDPVRGGYVAQLARPGGRVTGVTFLQSELPAKRVELLAEMMPGMKRLAILGDAASTGQLEVAQAAARRLGLEVTLHQFRQVPYQYEQAFEAFVRERCQALLALGSSNFVPARKRIIDLTRKHRLPTMFNNAVWVEGFGGLASYGPNFNELVVRAADQLAKVLKGARPEELPMEQPNVVELVVNLAAARAIGIAIPRTVAARADRVIE